MTEKNGFPPRCPRCGSDDPAQSLAAVYLFGWFGKWRGQCVDRWHRQGHILGQSFDAHERNP